MSVIKKSEFGKHAVYPKAHERACFKCGELVGTLPHRAAGLVIWLGVAQSDDSDSTITLHPECAKQLGMHLIKDGITAERGGA